MKYFLLTTILAIGTYAWDVTYYIDAQCRGEVLREDTYSQTSGNPCIPVDTVNIVSATVSNKLDGQGLISFYTGNDCTGSILGSADGDQCVEFSLNGFGSVGLNAV